MKIISDKNICENIVNGSGIFTSKKFKKIINEFYNPDDYIFFVDNNEIIPLIVKNNLVTFYGGLNPYNEYNSLPFNKELLNDAISFIIKNNLDFRLFSLKNDVFDILDDEHKKYDVPINQYWIYKDIQNFDLSILFTKWNRKRRYKVKKALSLIKFYKFHNVKVNQFLSNGRNILNKYISYFDDRKIESLAGKEELFMRIFNHFSSIYNMNIKYLIHNDEVVGVYILVFNYDSIFFWFGGPLVSNDKNISTLLYLDILETAKVNTSSYHVKYLDAMRGSFTYKKRMGFTPLPSYALVHDKTWKIKFDEDLSLKETRDLYKRKFGCELFK